MNRAVILNLETRRQIYNYIRKNPGVHFRDISRKLKISMYNLDYHLHILKKQGFVIEKKVNNYLRYHTMHSTGNVNKKILGF